MMTVETVVAGEELDLSPDPRVLQMLGEIQLEYWRCVAELIDNSIDGFLSAQRSGVAVDAPEIVVTLPNRADASARVQIHDNGPGMSREELELAVRAGYSGNNPIDNLGLFGMGFNVATARLGATTTVWTTRAGDDVVHGVRIDFADLRARRSFRTPYLTQSKADPEKHFTRIEVTNLKQEPRAELSKMATQRAIRLMLAKSYSAMLKKGGNPISFSLRVNDQPILARQHCVWGEDRKVEVPGLGTVPAFRSFDHRLTTDAVWCGNCLASMLETEVIDGKCVACGSDGKLVKRERRIRGWIGLQRYLHPSEFGIDIVRNGRKIEIANRELFTWTQDGVEEIEYPIDDPRNRGRFVGEIHLDHCPVDYSKQRFERSHRAWTEMVRFIRGEGPLRPQKAEELEYATNGSILFSHFKAFRRSSPSSSQAGGWQRVLVVKDNEAATQMADRFHKGEPDYQSDAKWWDRVVEEDQKRLYGDDKKKTGGDEKKDDETLDDVFGESGEPDDDAEEAEQPGDNASDVAMAREAMASLSRTYDLPKPLNASFKVDAFRVLSSDPDLEGAPWRLMRADPKSRAFTFIFDPEAEVFSSLVVSPLSALLLELSGLAHDGLRGGQQERPFSAVLAAVREAHGGQESLNATTIAQDAIQVLGDLAEAVTKSVPAEQRKDLFDEYAPEERARVASNLSVRGGAHGAMENGTFLRFFPELLAGLIESRPSLFFDGAVWDVEHDSLDYKDPVATLEAQRAVRDRYRSRLADAVWASALDRLDPPPRRDEIIRAVMALRLLVPDRPMDA